MNGWIILFLIIIILMIASVQSSLSNMQTEIDSINSTVNNPSSGNSTSLDCTSDSFDDVTFNGLDEDGNLSGTLDYGNFDMTCTSN